MQPLGEDNLTITVQSSKALFNRAYYILRLGLKFHDTPQPQNEQVPPNILALVAHWLSNIFKKYQGFRENTIELGDNNDLSLTANMFS